MWIASLPTGVDQLTTALPYALVVTCFPLLQGNSPVVKLLGVLFSSIYLFHTNQYVIPSNFLLVIVGGAFISLGLSDARSFAAKAQANGNIMAIATALQMSHSKAPAPHQVRTRAKDVMGDLARLQALLGSQSPRHSIVSDLSDLNGSFSNSFSHTAADAQPLDLSLTVHVLESKLRTAESVEQLLTEKVDELLIRLVAAEESLAQERLKHSQPSPSQE